MADRELKIKTGVVSRLAKELLSYKEELEENIKQTDAVRASSDHSKLKQWVRLLLQPSQFFHSLPFLRCSLTSLRSGECLR